MDRLNYHHLRYFREVARVGNLTRAAERLNLSQSALSTQIRQLEDSLGHRLFERAGRRLELTEAGGIALDHADRIFHGGEELVAALGQGDRAQRPLKVGAMSTLSRNFQLRFLQPILAGDDLADRVELILSSGSSAVLLAALRSLALDVVLSTEAPAREPASDLLAHKIAEQHVGLYGTIGRLGHPTLEGLLAAEPVILPTESSIRTGFDSLVARFGVTPRIAAEVDDMAMIRLLAREGVGLALAPAVVLADELDQGILQPAPFRLDIVEAFYALTIKRSFPHPLLPMLLREGFLHEQGGEVPSPA